MKDKLHRRSKRAVTRLRAWLSSQSIGAGIAKLVTGVAAAQVVTLVAYPIITRLFSPEAFGILSVYTSVVMILTSVSSLRYDAAIPIPRRQQRAFDLVILAIVINLLFSVALAILIWLTPAPLQLLTKGEVPTYLRTLIPLGVLIGGTFAALSMWAVRQKAFGTVSTTKLSQSLGTSAAQVGVGLIVPQGTVLVGAAMLGSGIGVLGLFRRTIAGRGLKAPNFAALRSAAVRYWRLSVLGAPTQLATTMSAQMPTVLISSLLGVAVAGQFGLAMRVIAIPLQLLGGSIRSVFFAEAASLGAERPREIQRLADRLTRRVAILSLLPASALVFFGPELFMLVFGPDWVTAGEFSRWLAIIIVMDLISVPFSSIFIIFERMHIALALSLVELAIVLTVFGVGPILGMGPVTTIAVYSVAIGLYTAIYAIVARLILRSAVKRRSSQADVPDVDA